VVVSVGKEVEGSEEGEAFSYPWETYRITSLNEFVQTQSPPPTLLQVSEPIQGLGSDPEPGCEEKPPSTAVEHCILFDLALPGPNLFSVNVVLVKEH
jgi:hypothetical protein